MDVAVEMRISPRQIYDEWPFEDFLQFKKTLQIKRYLKERADYLSTLQAKNAGK